MADRNDLLTSMLNVQRGGLPTHRVGDFSSDSSKNPTSEHQLDLEDEIISCTSGVVFESIYAVRLCAFLERHRSASLEHEVLTVNLGVARKEMGLKNQEFARAADFMRRCVVPASRQISAGASFSVTPSLVRDGSTVVAVSFALQSNAHANSDDASASSEAV